MLFGRKLLEMLKAKINDEDIIVVTGQRRTGKTTLLRMLFDTIPSENKAFLDFENPIEQRVFEEQDYNNILANLSQYGISKGSQPYVFIDEVQYKPEVVRAVKYLYDHHKVKFFITGSSSFYIKDMFPESLAGRKAVYELYPLDFSEFLTFKAAGTHELPKSFAQKHLEKNEIEYEKLKAYYSEYLLFGGFPAVVLANGEARKKELLLDVFKSYFEKDVRVMADFRNLNAFRDVLLLLLARTGSKVDVSKIASEIGVSRPTIQSYLSFLENTYFLHFLSPFSQNPDREVSGSRKVYACDNGIANLFGHASEGALFENAVFLNLRKHGKVNYYQRRHGPEIDFILDSGAVALEAKTTASETDVRKLSRNAESAFGKREHYVVTRNYSTVEGTLPAYMI